MSEELGLQLVASANQRVAHIMTKHVDEQQFMYAIQNEYMSGPLRSGFHNLLIAVHLQTHADARLALTISPFSMVKKRVDL